MNQDTLEEILSCPTLPSLPAVAVRVIELTSNINVSLDELAHTIQNDQALSAKILRTVNSSFYGLRERCSTIHKALVMLGLSPVKSLALGFSLVSSLDMNKEPRFDYVAYWRRGLFAGVAGKLIAEAGKLDCGDEAFLAGLLQDIGMVAMHQALKDDYLDVMARTDGDHNKLVRCELETFEVQHPDIGAMLGNRWRLPDELVIPIKYHERPTAAPNTSSEITRCVALGNIAHDALSDADSTPVMRRFFQRCEQWFKIDSETASETFKKIRDGVEQMSELFSLDTGEYTDAEEILNQADRQLIDIARVEPRESFAAQQLEDLVKDDDTDPVTGVLARKGFDMALGKAFTDMRERDEPVSVMHIALEGLREIIETNGPMAGDEICLSVVALLNRHFEPLGGIVARIGQSVFSLVLPGVDRGEAIRAAERFREHVHRAAPDWTRDSAGLGATISVSLGLANADGSNFQIYASPERLVVAASRAVQAARAAGGNCVRAFVPRIAA